MMVKEIFKHIHKVGWLLVNGQTSAPASTADCSQLYALAPFGQK